MKNSRDLILGEVVYIAINYYISDSLINLLDLKCDLLINRIKQLTTTEPMILATNRQNSSSRFIENVCSTFGLFKTTIFIFNELFRM